MREFLMIGLSTLCGAIGCADGEPHLHASNGLGGTAQYGISSAAGQTGGAGIVGGADSRGSGFGGPDSGGSGFGGASTSQGGSVGAVGGDSSGGADSCTQVSFSSDDPEARSLQDRISQAISAAPDCRSSAEAECALVSNPLDRGAPWCSSMGRRILHIDEFGYGGFERIHSRLLSYLAIDATGNYAEWSPTVTMQQGRFAIERQLGEVAFPLDGLNVALDTLAEKNPYAPIHAHGDGLLYSTHRRTPRAQSVLAPFPSMSCDAEQSRVELRRQVQSLKDFIVRYGVRYVVMAGGVTRAHFSQCAGGNADQLLRIQLEEFYAPLAAIPQTILIQSGPNPTETDRELQASDPEFLVDCTPIPGRIRVSFAAITRQDVPPEGVAFDGFRALLPVATRNTAACIDAFIAFFDREEEFLATSVVPPLMVGMAIAAENADPARLQATGAQRAAALIGAKGPRLYDPYSNDQFESN